MYKKSIFCNAICGKLTKKSVIWQTPLQSRADYAIMNVMQCAVNMYGVSVRNAIDK